MSRNDAIALAIGTLSSGTLREQLAHLVSIPTESQNSARLDSLRLYLGEMCAMFGRLGFKCQMFEVDGAPFLIAERVEDPSFCTVLCYGHGDVVRGQAESWAAGLSPWQLTEQNGAWYGRGVADNKGQHAIGLISLEATLNAREGRLGFNIKYLIEMGEEIDSPGLRKLCEEQRELLRADVFLASDGPRIALDTPTIFLGSRGCLTFDLSIDARKGAHHSGNWGGLISNPAIQLAHAIGSITNARGRILIREWLPADIPPAVRMALERCHIDGGPGAPEIDGDWGEPGLSPAEQVYGWCSFDVLAMEAGHPAAPIGAIPPRAWARCQLRFVVGVNHDNILSALRAHLDRHGFDMVHIKPSPDDGLFIATRLDPDNRWVSWAKGSIAATTCKDVAVLPNLGGSLPNDVFATTLSLPTVWVPHAYPGCRQHSADEHLPVRLIRESLAIMAGLYWDFGEVNPDC